MSGFFYEILYRPLFNALIILYNYLPLHDVGIAIVLLTILIRLILFPLFHKSARDQAIIQRLAPKVKEIQDTHKKDKEKQARALMELYREHRVNPLSGFLLILLQLPILIALYQVFLKGFSANSLAALYSFVTQPSSFGHYFLGFIDLTKRNVIVVLLAAIAQYFQGKFSLIPSGINNKRELTSTEAMSKQMVYLGPILTIVFFYFLNLPSAVGLYWLTTSAFSVIQQIIINRNVARYFEENKLKELK